MSRFIERAATGMLGGVLAFAALNSLSYFVRTGGNLRSDSGRIGFPWLVWENDGRINGQIDLDALLANAAVGLSASAAFGCLVAFLRRGERRILPPPVAAPSAAENGNDAADKPARRPPQFSLRGLLLLTASIAVLFAFGQEADEEIKRQGLMLLYWLGPAMLVSTYCLTARRAPHKRRQYMLFVAALVVLAICILGASAGLKDMTLVALGIYVYWTPQCVLLLASIWGWGLMRKRNHGD